MNLGISVSDWRPAVAHFSVGLLQVVVVSLTDFLDTILPVESLSYHFVCLDELINLFGQLVILMAYNSNVIVHRFNFNLKVRVVF